MDGTFRSAPSLFTQIYTIHAKVHGQFFPLVISLLPDKQEATYKRMILQFQNEARNRNKAFNPQIVHCDFEIATMNAVRSELAVEPTGCLFHFTQSIYRYAQSLGLQVGYNTDTPPGTRRWIRRLMGLPLVPPLRLQGAYRAVVDDAPNIAEAADMHQYIFQTYVDPNAALFPSEIWNVFGLQNRTINMCEGFHLSLNQAVSVRHPSVYRLIDTLRVMESSNERTLAQLAMGVAPKKRNPKYVAVNEALQRLADNTFGVGLPNIQQVMHYLDAVAYQLWDLKH